MHIHVIGSGVIGLTTAYYLCKKGHTVTILEKESEVANGASFANGGQLSYCFSDPMGKPNLFTKFPKIALNKDLGVKINTPSSVNSWTWLISFLSNCSSKKYLNNQLQLAELSLASKPLLQDIQNNLNLDFDYEKTRKMSFFENENDFAYEKKSIDIKRNIGNDNQVLSIKEAELIEPGITDLSNKYAGVIFSESDEVGDTYAFCKSLKDWLINHGTNFLFKTNVNSLKKNKTKLIGIETDKGFIESNKLIVCAGSLTDKIIETKPRIIPVRGYSLTLPKGSVPFDVSLTLSDQRILFTKLGKKVRITGFADFFSKTQDDKKRIDELLRSAKKVAPNLADYNSSSIEAWSGDRPLTPSSIPFIGPSKTQGVYINSGHGFYGWTLSFSSGKKIANYF
jgi:D-amino-acid dehydrogenase